MAACWPRLAAVRSRGWKGTLLHGGSFYDLFPDTRDGPLWLSVVLEPGNFSGVVQNSWRPGAGEREGLSQAKEHSAAGSKTV